jgi:hypothetical protein
VTFGEDLSTRSGLGDATRQIAQIAGRKHCRERTQKTSKSCAGAHRPREVFEMPRQSLSQLAYGIVVVEEVTHKLAHEIGAG